MKKVILFIFCINSYINIFSQTDSLHKKEIFKKYFHVNGNISSEGYLQNEVPEGFWISYYKTGVKKSEGVWKSGKLDSIWVFYDQIGDTIEKVNYYLGKKNGYHYKYFNSEGNKNRIEEKELFISGKRDGITFIYYESGEIKKIISYNNDKREGYTYEYDLLGNIITIYRYRKNEIIFSEEINRYDPNNKRTGIWKSFYDNGYVREEMEYYQGKLNGNYKTFDEQGNLKERYIYKNDQLDLEDKNFELDIEMKEEYDKDGKLTFQGSFKEEIKIGVHRYYDNKGNIKEAKTFNLNGILVAEGIVLVDGREDGKWIYHYENQKKKAEGLYDKGKKQGAWIYYYENGKIQQKGTYSKNKYINSWQWFYKNGYLLKEEFYINGKLDGESIEYDELGEVIAKGNYIEGLKEGEWLIKVGDHKFQGNYVMDLKDGFWKSYYLNNGQISFEGKFIQGNEDGKHLFYYPDGKVKEEQYYSEGEKIKSWSKYDESGKLIIVVQYKEGIIYKVNGEKINVNEEER